MTDVTPVTPQRTYHGVICPHCLKPCVIRSKANNPPVVPCQCKRHMCNVTWTDGKPELSKGDPDV